MFQQSLFELEMEFSILLENRISKNVVISYTELATLSVFCRCQNCQIIKALIDIGLKFFLVRDGKPWTTTDYVSDWLHRIKN